MNEQNSYKTKILAILSAILKREFTEFAPPKREDCETWDSLNHLEIVVLLEEEFNIRFSAEEVAKLNSFVDILETISRKKNEA